MRYYSFKHADIEYGLAAVGHKCRSKYLGNGKISVSVRVSLLYAGILLQARAATKSQNGSWTRMQLSMPETDLSGHL